MNKLQRTTVPAWNKTPLPAAVCVCGKTVRVRADGKSLFTHNCEPGSQCPMSREPVEFAD